MNFIIEKHDLDIIQNHDSFHVFIDNLRNLKKKLNIEGKCKIKTIPYRKGYPLDFNRMIAIESDGQSYILEFYKYKLIKITPVQDTFSKWGINAD